MGDVIFAKTRYQETVVHVDANGFEHKGYESYRDLWNMVEWAGYKTIFVDEIDPQLDNCYIVTPLNDEWLQGWDNSKAKIIHLEMEWRSDWRADVDTPKGVSETWVCDKAYAERIGARYVPMGGDARLNETPNEKSYKLYDVALLSYQTPRRQVITQQLQQNGLTIAPNSGLQGWARSMVLSQSKVMVHTHQTEQGKGIAPLRWCLAAAHHLPMVTETIPDRGIFTYSYMMQSDYTYLASFARGVIQDSRLLNNYAGALHQLLCHDYTFRKAVESHV